MLAEPSGFDREELARHLAIEWGMAVSSMRYVPVGFGTHHYRVWTGAGNGWFVNVDEVAPEEGRGGAARLEAGGQGPCDRSVDA